MLETFRKQLSTFSRKYLSGGNILSFEEGEKSI